jgi:hypothetical protein
VNADESLPTHRNRTWLGAGNPEWRASVPVHEVSRGQTIWQGETRANGSLLYLKSHPVESAVTAVRVQVVKDAKDGYLK